jgi:transposase-like protein
MTPVEIVKCPKCDASNEHITKFDRDVYIVRDNDDFVRRKLYGCNKCENLFTYDTTPRRESKTIKVQSIFSKIAKQCNSALDGVTIKT